MFSESSVESNDPGIPKASKLVGRYADMTNNAVFPCFTSTPINPPDSCFCTFPISQFLCKMMPVFLALFVGVVFVMRLCGASACRSSVARQVQHYPS